MYRPSALQTGIAPLHCSASLWLLICEHWPSDGAVRKLPTRKEPCHVPRVWDEVVEVRNHCEEKDQGSKSRRYAHAHSSPGRKSQRSFRGQSRRQGTHPRGVERGRATTT